MGSYSRFCGLPLPSSVSPQRGGGSFLAGCGPTLASPLRRDRARRPSPLALLPAAHSPSRAGCLARWWALTPPVRPLPGNRAGFLSVAVVVGPAFAVPPPLAVSWGGLTPHGAGSREVPLAGTSQPATAPPSTGPEYSTERRACQRPEHAGSRMEGQSRRAPLRAAGGSRRQKTLPGPRLRG